MKFKKTIISMLMVFLIVISSVPSFAAANIVIKASDFKSTNGTKNGNYNIYSETVLFGYDVYMQYELDCDAERTYHVIINAKEDGTNCNLQVLLNNKEAAILKVDNTAYEDIYVGELKFNKGTNRLRIVSTDLFVYMKSITLVEARSGVKPTFSKNKGKYKNHTIPTKIQAEDFDFDGVITDAKVNLEQRYRNDSPLQIKEDTLGNITVPLSRNEGLKYTFNVDSDGIYQLKIYSINDGKYRIYYDDNKGYITAELESLMECGAGNVYLTKGTHTLTLIALEERASLDYFRFTSANGKYILLNDLENGKTFEINLETEEKENPVWKEFYVSPDASGNGNGSKSNPFKSIEEAKNEIAKISSVMKGDIVVNILPGRYLIREKMLFTEKDSGKNGFNIIYRGTDSENKPIIDGGAQITGWQKADDKVYKATVCDEIKDIRQLYVNGYMAQRARSKYQYVSERVYDNPDTTSPQDGFYVSRINFPVMSNPEDVEIVFNINWTNQRMPVEKMEDAGSEILITYDHPYASYAFTRNYQTTAPLAGNFFYIENAAELIDEPGEFYFDKKTKTVFYYPFPEENMETAEIYTGISEGMILAEGSSVKSKIKNITFDNIEFRHGAWNDVNRRGLIFYQADAILPEKDNVVEVHACDTLPVQVWFNNAENIKVNNCNFINMGSTALGFVENVNDSEAKGNLFRDLSGSGITIGHWRYNVNDLSTLTQEYVTKRINIENNVIRRVSYEYYDCVGIGIYYANNINVENNDIAETAYSGISMGWGWGSTVSNTLMCTNNRITDNKIVNVSNTVVDGGPIYTLSEQNYSVLSGNYLKSNGNDYGGIYFDNGSKNITAHDNVMEGAQNAFFGGVVNTGDIWDMYDNYTDIVDNEKSYVPWGPNRQTEGKMEIKERPIRYAKGYWGPEAREIIANAGLDNEYSYLLENAELPSWRTNFMLTNARLPYTPKDVLEVFAPDYMPGGEGIGYHKNQANTEPKLFKQMAITVIGSTAGGEWMNYEVEVPESGDYYIKLYYSLAFNGTEENYSDFVKTTVSVDGEVVADSVFLNDTGSWLAYQGQDIAKHHFEKGKHIVKVQFVDGGFSYYKFKLVPDGMAANEPTYDDGIMFKLQ